MDVVRRLEQAEYYVDLLFKMIDEEKCPFYSLIIKKKARKKDIERILNLCEILNEQYVVEKAEGLLLFDALLDQFEKALPHQARSTRNCGSASKTRFIQTAYE